jgi:predicted acyltransferase
LRSIDAFRGAVLAFMVFTPVTGDPEVYPLLRHAAWDGPTASDLILPTFLVTSGFSLAFLLRPPVGREKMLRLVRRLALLVLLGLVYNAYGTTGFHISALRYTGVLQLIGISGFLAAGVVLLTRRHGQDRPALVAAVALALPAAYAVGLHLLADRCAGANMCSPYAGWDRRLLDAAHTYGNGTPGYDPEGVAICITATSLVLVGYLVGRRLTSSPAAQLPRIAATTAFAGVALLGCAWFLDAIDAANKRLLTPAFVTLAAGVALIGIAVFVVVLDLRLAQDPKNHFRRIAFPLVSLGRNALIVYLLERFLLQTAATVQLGDRPAREVILDALPGSATTIHLSYTTALLLVIVVVTGVLHWRQRYVTL